MATGSNYKRPSRILIAWYIMSITISGSHNTLLGLNARVPAASNGAVSIGGPLSTVLFSYKSAPPQGVAVSSTGIAFNDAVALVQVGSEVVLTDNSVAIGTVTVGAAQTAQLVGNVSATTVTYTSAAPTVINLPNNSSNTYIVEPISQGLYIIQSAGPTSVLHIQIPPPSSVAPGTIVTFVIDLSIVNNALTIRIADSSQVFFENPVGIQTLISPGVIVNNAQPVALLGFTRFISLNSPSVSFPSTSPPFAISPGVLPLYTNAITLVASSAAWHQL